MIFKCVLIFSLFFASASFSKSVTTKKSTRKPSQVEVSPIRFKVVYGEKTTYFVVSKTRIGGRIEFSNNLGAHNAKDISAPNYEFLKTKVSMLTEPFNKKEFCPRNFVEINDSNRQILGCLGAPNKLAIEVQETVNLLSMLF